MAHTVSLSYTAPPPPQKKGIVVGFGVSTNTRCIHIDLNNRRKSYGTAVLLRAKHGTYVRSVLYVGNREILAFSALRQRTKLYEKIEPEK